MPTLPTSSKLTLAFDAVFYYTNDMPKAIAFYRDVLGFPLVSRDYVARFEIDGVLFELVPNPANAPISGTGNARISLGVEDIHQAARELHVRGVTTTPVKEEPGGLLAYFKDPDGNELCLWQST